MEMETSLGALFIQGGWVMWPLLIFSVVTWAIVLERAYVYLTLRPRLNKMVQSLQSSVSRGDIEAAKQICHSEKPALNELFLSTIDTRNSREKAERITIRNSTRFMQSLKKNLWVLGTIGSAAPFVGLLGTVVGIVRAFGDMKKHGGGGFDVVAGGISEALIATAAGLVVAIVALLTYNVFVTAANQTVATVKLTLDELLDHAHSEPTAEA